MNEVHVCKPGEVSEYVYAMQYLLKYNDCWPQGDGYDAIDTSKWLLKFKKREGLGKLPICDEPTWNALYEGIELCIGDEGYAVRAMQHLLKAHDYFMYTDQIFGSQSYTQLCRFQKNHGLEETGTCDKATWDELIKEA